MFVAEDQRVFSVTTIGDGTNKAQIASAMDSDWAEKIVIALNYVEAVITIGRQRFFEGAEENK